jgi:NAD(P)-dependent dehydrogenase (short-subunit alcohol dehydrogenase family)
MTKILITGANRGLGAGLARACLKRGWTVIAAVRDPEALAGQFAGDIRPVRFSLDDLSTIGAVAEATEGALDVFISNAAMTGGPLGAFGSFDVDRFLAACKANAAAPMKLLEALAPALAARRGKALVISSRLGANPFYGYAEYFASKTALNMLVKQASMPLAEQGVAVAACHPGWVGTEATGAMGQAPLTPDSGADLLLVLVERMTLADAGKFFDPDGSELPIVPQQHEVKFYSKPRTATL